MKTRRSVKTTTIDLISKKTTLHLEHAFSFLISKKQLCRRLGLFVVVVYFYFSPKFRAATCLTAETSGCLKCKISPQVTWKGGRTDGWADDYVTTKISWMHRQPNFLTHGTPRSACESSAITNLLGWRQTDSMERSWLCGWLQNVRVAISADQI